MSIIYSDMYNTLVTSATFVQLIKRTDTLKSLLVTKGYSVLSSLHDTLIEFIYEWDPLQF